MSERHPTLHNADLLRADLRGQIETLDNLVNERAQLLGAMRFFAALFDELKLSPGDISYLLNPEQARHCAKYPAAVVRVGDLTLCISHLAEAKRLVVQLGGIVP